MAKKRGAEGQLKVIEYRNFIFERKILGKTLEVKKQKQTEGGVRQRHRTSLNLEKRKGRHGGRQCLAVNRHMRTKHGKLKWVEWQCVVYAQTNACMGAV